jgi:DNA-binding transcriptional MerR regulator
MADEPRYSVTDLAGLAGDTPSTLRFYLTQGLLPSPGSTGPGVHYGDEHLDRLRLIRRLQREHLPLAEIRRRLAGLDDAQISELAGAPPAADSLPPPDPSDSALDYVRRLLSPPSARPVMTQRSLLKRVQAAAEAPAPYAAAPSVAPPPPTPSEGSAIERSQWERIALAEDVELHVRRPLPRPLSRKVDRLVTIARELLEEDPS